MENLKAKIKQLLIDNPGCRNKASEIVKLIHTDELAKNNLNRSGLYYALDQGIIHQADTIKRYYRQVKSELRLEHPEWFEDTREQEEKVKQDLDYNVRSSSFKEYGRKMIKEHGPLIEWPKDLFS